MSKLYTVTTVAPSGIGFGGARLVAVCLTLERAEEIVAKNECDIWEYSYHYAVIETVEPDSLYGFGEEAWRAPRWWYAWQGDPKTGGYQPIEVPERYKNLMGFWESGPIRNELIELRDTVDRLTKELRQAEGKATARRENPT